MRIYVDTNVYMDFLLKRKNRSGRDLETSSGKLFYRAMECRFEIIFSNEVMKELNHNVEVEKTRMLLALLQKKLIKVTANGKLRGDALHMWIAEQSGAEYIVTRNLKDFRNSSVKAVQPEELL